MNNINLEVNQRKKLSDKGGVNCDVLLMSATPIPRTLNHDNIWRHGSFDNKRKAKIEKRSYYLFKLDTKINDVVKFVKKEIKNGNQVFWVCPLIEEFKKIDHTSAIKKYKFLYTLGFPKK